MPTDIKVLQITARSDLGGGPRHLVDLLQSLEGKDFEISVAAPTEEPFGPVFRQAAANFFEMPHRRFSVTTLFKLRKFIQDQGINILHSHGRGAGLYSRLLGLITRTKVVHTFHGIHREKNLKGEIKYWADRFLAFLPFHAVFVSEFEAHQARTTHVVTSQSGTVLWNAVDLNRFQSQPKKILGDRVEHVGIFLRNDLVKGPDRYLALVVASANTDSLRFVQFSCAGVTGEELSEYGVLPSTLDIKGKLSNPIPYLSSLDVYVSTSRAEGLPLGVLEAMAARVPCLLSKIPAHEIFFEAKCAISFELNDNNSFTAALVKLSASGPVRADMIKRAQILLTSRHSLEVFGNTLAALYRSEYGTRI